MGMNPVREYRTIVDDSGDPGYVNRLLVATPTTGLLRVEWVQARYGQIIPTNWSMVSMLQYVNGYMPMRYQVDDAQNLIARQAIRNDMEWLFLLEHDNLLPANALVLLHDWIKRADTPIVSGLYYTRSQPSEPLVFRRRGTSVYTDFEMGDKVWCDGVPTGVLLIHMSIIRTLWEESPEYLVGRELTRRIFETPRHSWASPDSEAFNTMSGTSDLYWCDRIMDDNIFEKAGWTDYAKKKYPFVVDTSLFCGHIEQDGRVFPPNINELQNVLNANMSRRSEADDSPTEGK